MTTVRNFEITNEKLSLVEIWIRRHREQKLNINFKFLLATQNKVKYITKSRLYNLFSLCYSSY